MRTTAAAALLLGLAAAAPRLHLAPSDPTITYSPYVWLVNGSTATTLNTGAAFRVLFTGDSLNLTFDTSLMVAPASQLYYAIDNGPRTPFVVGPSIPVAVPANLTHGDVPYHLLTVSVKSMTETSARWAAAGATTRVVFTGLELEAGATTAAIVDNTQNILIYVRRESARGARCPPARAGPPDSHPLLQPSPPRSTRQGDSITEGVLTLGGSQRFDTDHNDNSVCYSHALGPLLGANMGVVGFGATGLSRGGSGGVPALGVSWNQLWEGVPRVFEPRPDLIVFNEGTNDGANNITLAMAAVLSSLMAACPGTPIVVLRPFNGNAQAANLQAACAASAQPALCHYVSTEGFYNTTYGGGLHPTGPNDVGLVAPAIANAVRPILAAAVAARHALSAEEQALVVPPSGALQLTSEERELVLAHRARRR